MKKIKILPLITLAMLLSVTYFAYGASVIGSVHDLSLNGGFPSEPCQFCHVPHNANPDPAFAGAPLWNRIIGPVTFVVYSSATMNTSPSNPPTGVSLACLSCHDGVLASNDKHSLYNDPITHRPPDTSSSPDCTNCHSEITLGRPSKIKTPGTDMSNDHPLSMPYPTAAQDPFFVTPPDSQRGWGGPSQNDVKLYNGRVECASCHNVHDPAVSPFLRKSNAASSLCLTCHIK
ncbi:MAG: cytochrome c3 family protein [Nitrospirae bacterium]|nr:cytochrome c3 family protein [Nitrospirota bacterium]